MVDSSAIAVMRFRSSMELRRVTHLHCKWVLPIHIRHRAACRVGCLHGSLDCCKRTRHVVRCMDRGHWSRNRNVQKAFVRGWRVTRLATRVGCSSPDRAVMKENYRIHRLTSAPRIRSAANCKAGARAYPGGGGSKPLSMG